MQRERLYCSWHNISLPVCDQKRVGLVLCKELSVGVALKMCGSCFLGNCQWACAQALEQIFRVCLVSVAHLHFAAFISRMKGITLPVLRTWYRSTSYSDVATYSCFDVCSVLTLLSHCGFFSTKVVTRQSCLVLIGYIKLVVPGSLCLVLAFCAVNFLFNLV